MLNYALCSIGYTHSLVDPYIYYCTMDEECSIIVIHVDDMLLAASMKEEMLQMKEDLYKLPFETVELGEP
ncbi:hypothetical protein EW146_g8263 [Bondarzewia mesenterica]|uniref:Reverse transcriptase Ty1/copia-type domain-containing protein n=1 Tax=Bondarzewia mesenterica TaxID=1095465 RepID=A0A4V3XDR6_9AGAM|nr:hypothetical protein EW146_g8263 [Bondarzewia mesenterica]